jgi:acetylornithine deacetylase/succinyl-diaminopimelate desuccinylase-like protein
VGSGKKPVAIPSLGATDCKFWRYHGVPAYVFGVSPETMAARDESVSVEEFLTVVKTHALAAWEYLGGKS